VISVDGDLITIQDWYEENPPFTVAIDEVLLDTPDSSDKKRKKPNRNRLAKTYPKPKYAKIAYFCGFFRGKWLKAINNTSVFMPVGVTLSVQFVQILVPVISTGYN
jgi:hypothetical protein